MSSTFEPARSNYSTSKSVEAINSSAPLTHLQKPKQNRVVPLHQIQKKNKQAVAAFFCKTIKDSLDEEMNSLIEPYATVQLTSNIRRSFDSEDVLTLRNNSKELEKFNFKKSNKFRETIKSKIFIKPGSHNGYAIMHIPAFVPNEDLDVPHEATNFKISAKLICLSDFEYSSDLKTYVPKDDSSHGASGQFETTMLPVLRIQTQPITTQIRVSQKKPIESNVSSILVLAIKFYKYDQGQFRHLLENGSMKLVKVF